MKKEYSISLIRLMATIMIVLCHFMQYENFFLAWWFNVGVQVFLVMSGYLYGRRSYDDGLKDIDFYKKQIKKILVDYYIVLFSVIIIQYIITPSSLSFSRIVKSVFLYDTLLGGAHLWYIPYILMCYILTPFLVRLFNHSYDIKTFIIVLSVVCVVFELHMDYFNSAWIVCYVIGLFYGISEIRAKYKSFIEKSIIVLACFTNCIQIYMTYISDINTSGIRIWSKYCNYAHVLLGCAIFIVCIKLFNKVKFEKNPIIKKLCDLSDFTSYDIYLTHQFFILGPLSLMGITSIYILNIVIVLLAIVMFTIAVVGIKKLLRV